MATTLPADPERARSCFDQAVGHHLAGRAREAIAAYRQALAIDPTLAAAMNNLGTLLAPHGAVDEALALFERARAVQPTYGEAHNNLGITLANLGRHAEAIDAFRRAVELEPSRPLWWNNLGNSSVECFRFGDAIAAYDRAIALDANTADFWSNRGLALRGLRRPDDAIASFERALALDPAFTNALSNLGVVLKEQRRLGEAVAVFERARSARSHDPALLCNYAAVHEAAGDYERMRELALEAHRIDPRFAEAHVLLGNYFMERGEYGRAEAEHERARALDPDNRNANWNLALIWLLRGDFERGWRQFAWRRRLQSVLLDQVERPGEAWAGEPLNGRTMLLYAEQGIGDAIHFARYAEVVKSRGAGRVVLEVPPAVAPILASVPGVDEVVASGTLPPRYDVHASLMDLPHLCGTRLQSIPASIQYVAAEQRPVSAIVGGGDGLRVGIVWAGNPAHQRDHLRSLSLDRLGPLLAVENVGFYSLQKGGPERALSALAHDRVMDLAPHLNDFRDTAAAIARLDLVITVDTSVAHLAAALGCETWVMITHVPDFRWMLERADSPWYPTVRLFRQPTPGDWASVVDSVSSALRERAAQTLPREAEGAAEEAMTVLASATRHPDGRRRFELSIPLARLADAKVFAAYERELLGEGHERVAREFIREIARDGDVLIDPEPGLGLTALCVATLPQTECTAHLLEPDAHAADRLRAAARGAGLGERVVTHRSLATLAASARTCESGDQAERRTAENRRVVLRIADPARTGEHLSSFGAYDAGTIDVVVWPSARLAHIAASRDALESGGYWIASARLVDGEVTLDPVTADSDTDTIVAIRGSLLGDLTSAEVSADLPSPVERSGAEPAQRRWLAFDWEVRADTGWGVYGLNLAAQLAERNDLAPLILGCEPTAIPALVRHRLDSALESHAEIARALNDAGATVTIEGTLLRAFGNNFGGSPYSARVRAVRNVGVIFFEDTVFDGSALDVADTLDTLVAGSTWNADVLRSLELRDVRTVLQGIDPTVFHPAPRSGLHRDRFVIFSGGKLEYRKGQDIVAAAFRRFHARHADALLVTAWHNPWPALIADLELAGHVRGIPAVHQGALQIRSWLAANGIPADAVIDVGCVPNALMGQIVREADVALFPNRCEGGTNLVAMECMASGVPTIVSANTGHRDLIATGGCFPLEQQRPVKPPTRFYRGSDGWGESDVDEIVALLEQLYHDRSRAHSRATIGAEAMAQLTWTTQIDALLRELGPLL